jgi:hypothetical protein
MQIDRIGFSGTSVVVLGAGATRGSEFVPRDSQVLPPLDADFFSQAQRLPSGESTQLMRSLVADAVKIFGKNFKLTMEGFLTQIEHLANALDDYKHQGRPPQNPYRKIRQDYLQVLACVMHEAIGTTPTCGYHETSIGALGREDTVISFNYDCAIDYMLKVHGHGRWNAENGYGHPCNRHTIRAWNPVNPAPSNDTLLLLKMHGSLNWRPYPEEKVGVRLKLKERWWRQHGDEHFEIVPPEWNKPTIRRGIYRTIWRRARERLKNCSAIVFIGYSLPPTDLPVQALFRVDGQTAERLKLLVVANPDPEVRRQIRDVLRRELFRKRGFWFLTVLMNFRDSFESERFTWCMDVVETLLSRFY